MSTVFSFFKRKAWGLTALATCACFVWFCFYAFSLTRVEKRTLQTNFYYLVSSSTHLEASTHQAVLSGGAGYLLSHGGQEYVAFAVYFNEDDGLVAQRSLTERRTESVLLQKSVSTLYFKTSREKSLADLYISALKTGYACMELLNAEIARLEKGATQESSKRVLSELERVTAFLSQTYEREFPSFSAVCAGVSNELQILLADTVYANDLRYLLCDWSLEYIDLCNGFSL